MYLLLVIVTLLGFFSTHSLAKAVPLSIALSSRKLNKLQGRGLQPSTIPLKDFFLGTDLQYAIVYFKSFSFCLISVPTHSGGSEIYQVSLFFITSSPP